MVSGINYHLFKFLSGLVDFTIFDVDGTATSV